MTGGQIFHVGSTVTVMQGQFMITPRPTLNQVKRSMIGFWRLVGMQNIVIIGICSELVLSLLIGWLTCVIYQRSFEMIEGGRFVGRLGVKGGSWRRIVLEKH